jgi:hypothetical protein
MTGPSDAQEELRKNALTAFLDARVAEGYWVDGYARDHRAGRPRLAVPCPPPQGKDA